jgi:hypothetical protein
VITQLIHENQYGFVKRENNSRLPQLGLSIPAYLPHFQKGDSDFKIGLSESF